MNAEEGKKIARTLLEKRLVACATLLPPVVSLYHWEGAIEEAEECKVLLKTVETHFEEVEQTILHLSTYTTPEIAAWPVSRVHSPYEKWLHQNLK